MAIVSTIGADEARHLRYMPTSDEKEDCALSRSILSHFCRGFVYLIYLSICIEVALQGFYYVTAGDFLFRRVALPIYAREPHAGFGNRPGLSFDHRTKEFHAHYYINQAGFRVPRPDVEYTVAKSANIYRIMILGPSFAFGWGADYELSFAGVLQQLLQERGFAGEKEVEVINAGIPAMPVAPQLAWFEQVGKHYEPDLVIQFVYGSMVIRNVSEPLYAVDDKGYLVSLNSDAGWRWREGFKKLATVFYGWVLWTKLISLRWHTRRERWRRIGSGTRHGRVDGLRPNEPRSARSDARLQ